MSNKKITVTQWSIMPAERFPYKNGVSFKYSKTKRSQIIAEILDLGYHVMVKNTDEGCTIYADFYSNPFRQR